MQFQINSSDKIKLKLTKGLASLPIEIVDDAPFEIVERGHDFDPEKINIIFNPLDYDEIISLLTTYVKPDMDSSENLTGFLDNKYCIIHIPDVYYIEAQNSQVVCHTAKGAYTVKKTLSYYERELKTKGIVRINKSQLANMKKVKEIIPWFNSRLVFTMEKGIDLEVSKLYSKNIRKMLNI